MILAIVVIVMIIVIVVIAVTLVIVVIVVIVVVVVIVVICGLWLLVGPKGQTDRQTMSGIELSWTAKNTCFGYLSCSSGASDYWNPKGQSQNRAKFMLQMGLSNSMSLLVITYLTRLLTRSISASVQIVVGWLWAPGHSISLCFCPFCPFCPFALLK